MALVKVRIFIYSHYNRDVEILMLPGICPLCLQSAPFADTLFISWHQRKSEIEMVKFVQASRDRGIVFVFLNVWRYMGFYNFRELCCYCHSIDRFFVLLGCCVS